MSAAPDSDGDIVYALVCLKTGVVLAPCASRLAPCLDDLAAAAPELFRMSPSSDLSALFSRLGSERTEASFQEIVIISPLRAHVVHRLEHRPDQALLGVSEDVSKLGLLVSGARARMLELEASP